ncbi:uncharacterized protein LOC133173017 isoform X1 [Saccostrea echinata]|uniref:uncharacterized protein LOC133173017 isoform X1 n=1 Tax=Saccostrea echinata TaxID=191078 RepID=UPI002A827939|nr:uncharacterized protein LOC133173017 isoform X1 [Saccostrea echinata]
MATEVANAPIKTTMEIPDPIPAGNWMARQLRMLNDNSEGLLPPSAGSKRSWDKYNTVTHKDYLGPSEFTLEEPNYEVEPFQKKRETVADIMLAPNNRQTFNNWQMPSRFTSMDDKVEHYDPPLHLKSEEPAAGGLETVEEEVQALNISPTPKAPSPIKRTLTSLQGPQKINRQNSLPELRLRSCSPRKDPGGVKSPTKLGDVTRSSPMVRSKTDIHHRVPMVARSMTNIGGTTAQEDFTLREEFRHSLQPHVLDKAEQWMKLAPNADRKVIEKVLRMADKRQKLGGTLNKSLQPDAKEVVDKWLFGASEAERQVALRFFNSLAGEKLMGKGINEQKKRLEQVINALENEDGTIPLFLRGKGNGPYADTSKFNIKGRTPGQKQSRFNHLRLLSPGTRRERWMHTTWHHLPEYRNDDPVENWSSHYIRPHAVIPRHFVIHPDWG